MSRVRFINLCIYLSILEVSVVISQNSLPNIKLQLILRQKHNKKMLLAIRHCRTFTPDINILPQSIRSTFRGVFQASGVKSVLTSVGRHAARMRRAIPERLSVRLKNRIWATDFYKQNTAAGSDLG